MNTVIILICLIGIAFPSPLGTEILQHDHIIEDGSQEKDKEFATISNEYDLQNLNSRGPTSGFDVLELDGEISKSLTLPIKYLLNLEKNARDQKGPRTLDIVEISNDGKQFSDLNKNKDNERKTESVVFIQDGKMFTSNDEESQDSLLLDDKSEDYEPVLMKSSFEKEEVDASNKGEYIDISSKPYNNKHLKYILNMTQSVVKDEHELKNETELNNKEPKEHILALPFGVRLAENNIYEDKNNTDFTDQVESDQLEDSFLQLGSEKNASEGNDTRSQNSTAEKMITVKVLNQEPITRENHTSLQDKNERQPEHTSHANQDQAEKNDVEKLFHDPCRNLHCKRGKLCEIDLQGNPGCVCQDPKICPPGNVNDHVCGTDNKTYDSPCHLFGTKCKLEGTKEGSHLHLDYQGHCKSIPPCSEYELALFPYRMRDWLKNVLVQLYERDLENSGFLSDKQRDKVKKIYENEKRLLKGDHNIDLLLRDFEKNYYMYVYPVHWQFNQLDQNLMDRLLTRSELAPLRVPLVPMEHCVTAFFQKCNTNKDKHISLTEWCQCFGIREEDINEDLLF